MGLLGRISLSLIIYPDQRMRCTSSMVSCGVSRGFVKVKDGDDHARAKRDAPHFLASYVGSAAAKWSR
jgi:hypothetical protein